MPWFDNRAVWAAKVQEFRSYHPELLILDAGLTRGRGGLESPPAYLAFLQWLHEHGDLTAEEQSQLVFEACQMVNAADPRRRPSYGRSR